MWPAKFSTVKTVKTHQVAKLAYKYMFSISPISTTDTVVGLCVFNGQSDVDDDKMHNIYDFELAGAISPKAEIITLTENAINNGALHEVLLHNAVGLYVSHPPRKTMLLPRPAALPEVPHKSQRAEGAKVPVVSSGNATVPEETPVELSATSVSDMVGAASLVVANPAAEISTEARAASPQKQIAKKKKGKAESDPMLLDIAVLKLDKNTAARLQESGVTTIGDLVPNRSKHDLADNPILNRKLRREIEARLKALKVVLSATPTR